MDHNLRDAVCLAGSEKIRAVLRKMMFPDWLGNMLLNAILQLLTCTFSVLTIAVVYKVIYDIALVMGR